MSKLQAKLTRIQIKPDRDGGDPTITVQLTIEWTREILELCPRIGQLVDVEIRPLQMTLSGMDRT